MLVITVEIYPGGDECRKREIARMVASNVSNLADVSTYDVATMEKASPVTGLPNTRQRFAIKGHRRRQSVFALIAAAAKEVADRTVGQTPGSEGTT